MKELFGKFVVWLLTTRLWYWFASEFLAHFTFRWWGYTKFDCSKYEHLQWKISTEARKGIYIWSLSDRSSAASKTILWAVKILNSVSGKESYNLTHSGIFNLFEENVVIHMKGEGIRKDHILNIFKECDDFKMNFVPLSNDQLAQVKHRVDYLLKKKVQYDYPQSLAGLDEIVKKGFTEDEWRKFIDANPSLYCSEMVLAALVGIVPLTIPTSLGVSYFDPDCVVELGESFFEYFGSKENE